MIEDEDSLSQASYDIGESGANPIIVADDLVESRSHLANDQLNQSSPGSPIVSIWNSYVKRVLTVIQNNFIYRLFFGTSADNGEEHLIAMPSPVFLRRFELKYGRTHPTFFEGTYRQAQGRAKEELRFLLVYIHANNNVSCDKFCREILCRQTMADFVDANMLFWATSISSMDGIAAIEDLQTPVTIPSLCVSVLQDNRMDVVAQLVDLTTERDVMSHLGRIIDDAHHFLIEAQARRDQYRVDQILRREQDEAYEQSLLADREKARIKQAELDQRAEVVRELQQLAEKEQRRREELALWKEDVRNRLLPQSLEDEPETVRVIVKLPNGIRLDRRFPRNASTEQLYFYILLHEAAPDNFNIVQNFPRRVLPCDPRVTDSPPNTFASANLCSGEIVFVHDLDA